MTVVADTSPLIFLGKLRRFNLLRGVLGEDIRVPRVVYTEVFAPGVEPVERTVLKTFLDTCTIKTVTQPRSFAGAMSAADNAVLTLAVRDKADVLLCDERITRTMAEAEGIRPLGTLGVLLKAMDQDMLTPAETRLLVERLVGSHSFRIGVEVYQRVLSEINKAADLESP